MIIGEKLLYIAELIVAIALIGVVLLQAKGTTASAFFTRDVAASYRTRRGVEKTLFNATIVLAVTFFCLALLHTVLFSS